MDAKLKADDLVGSLYQKVREMILNGELLPGQKLIQEELADRLGVSRTPLMRALIMLEGDMLVKSFPHRGIYVRKLTLEELRDAFQLRNSIESVCAGLAAERATKADVEQLRSFFKPFAGQLDEIDPRAYQRADQEFHAKIIELSGNRIVREMAFVTNLMRLTYQFGLVRYPHTTYEEHLRVIEGIAAGDRRAAEEAMQQHLGRSVEALDRRMADPVSL